jgi:hypothetical protein
VIAVTVRRATWIALPLIAGLGRVSPSLARAITFGLVGTIGIAHGANDDRILARLVPRFPGGRTAISLGYFALALGVFALAARAPRSADRALKLLTWYHFGSGDVALARACGTPPPFIDTFARGAIPLVVTAQGRRTGPALALAYALSQLVRGETSNALDVAVPAVTLAFAPASLGFATYFGAWHAPRHLALVLERDERAGSFRSRLHTFARESTRNTLLAFAVGAASFALLRDRAEPRALATALILAITVPHEGVVWFAERAARRAR